jgi:NADH-quinone oxidoreductase subunit L
VSHGPFLLGVVGALLTAFYMTRQVYYVFLGNCRLARSEPSISPEQAAAHSGKPHANSAQHPHESAREMTVPLGILAACSILLGILGTPAWPWFQEFVEGGRAAFEPARLVAGGTFKVMALSTVVVFAGLGLGWWLYGRQPLGGPEQADSLERLYPNVFTLLRRKYYVDEAYEWAVVGFNAWWGKACDWLDRTVWSGCVQLVSLVVLGLAWVDRFFDEYAVNFSFDELCRRLTGGGRLFSKLQDGRVQNYLRFIGVGLVVLVLCLLWGCRS